ncbi:uncharacterized protein LOC128599196 isoform X1 [Ictalurus furcatus]|uniref:uncharacterized protein LOC128599196 isoform X1 n=1 Tax=Ictalurus furcatus TaxID=66913 RepID=UPI0023505CB3|nr:uncharacterized protein LOC128599196 isoform X1 [Ictalurus furcatus]
MLFFLCVMGLLSETLCSSALEAEPGDNVTIWCEHEMVYAGYIFWFYQYLNTASLSTTSVPRLVGCKHFKTSGSPQNCYFYDDPERMVISVHGKNTSLTITAVNVSDTGLYYCSSMQLNQISFSNSSYLKVKGGNETLPKNSQDKAQDPDSSAVFFMLNVVFGAVIVILLGVLIFIILTNRKTHRVDNAEAHQEHDSVNYGPVQLCKKTKRTRGRGEIKELCDVYSYVVYQQLA